MSHSSSSPEIPLTTTIPTDAQIPYTAPSIPILISLLTYLMLLALPTLLSNAYPIPVHSPHPNAEHKEKGIIDSAPEKPNETRTQSYTLNAALSLILPLLLGALFGPSITSNSILSTTTERTLMDIGYIGLLLLIFEAGVSLDAASLKLMRNNAALSTLAALTGVLVPIALGMGLGMGAYRYTGLQAFASGAALCSTSLGTTLALLASSSSEVDLRRTRVGCVLICAALLDDIIGLVIAGIIPGLAESESGVRWPTVVRPILVSLAFGLGTPVAAMWLRWLIRFPWKGAWTMMRRTFDCRCRRSSGFRQTVSATCRRSVSRPRSQFLFIFTILILMSFVAGSSYAGTSELFGAYLAGAFIGHVFGEEAGLDIASRGPDNPPSGLNISNHSNDSTENKPDTDESSENPAHAAFVIYLQPILTHLLAPLFFASIGAALPIKSMFTTHPDAVQITFTGSDNITVTEIDNGRASHRVIWRGLVYAVLMVVGKMVVGIWMLIWPDPSTRACLSPRGPRREGCLPNDITPMRWFANLKLVFKSSPGRQHEDLPKTLPQTQEENDRTPSNDPSRMRSALLLGLAMVARGEIALIVAQLARPLLVVSTPSSSTSTMTSAATTGTEAIASMSTIIPVPDEEPFAIVIWAILVSTVGGALGVGVLVASWKKKDQEEARRKNRWDELKI